MPLQQTIFFSEEFEESLSFSGDEGDGAESGSRDFESNSIEDYRPNRSRAIQQFDDEDFDVDVEENLEEEEPVEEDLDEPEEEDEEENQFSISVEADDSRAQTGILKKSPSKVNSSASDLELGRESVSGDLEECKIKNTSNQNATANSFALDADDDDEDSDEAQLASYESGGSRLIRQI